MDSITELRYKMMKRDAVELPVSCGDDLIDIMKKMMRMSCQGENGRPVKCNFYNGSANSKKPESERGFVIPAKSGGFDETMKHVINQLEDPQSMSSDHLLNMVSEISECQANVTHKDTYLDAMQGAFVLEALKRDMNNVEKMDTFALANCYFNLSWEDENISVVNKLLADSVKKYMSGEKTFEPTIHNVSRFSGSVGEFALKEMRSSNEEVAQRFAETKKEMLANVDGKNVGYMNDSVLSFLNNTAKEFPEDEAAKNVNKMTTEKMIEKFNRRNEMSK